MADELQMADTQAIIALHQRGWSHRRIARTLGMHRETVARHVALAAGCGSKPATNPPPGSGGPGSADSAAGTPFGDEAPSLPEGAARKADSGPVSDCEPFREEILAKLGQGLTGVRIWQDLVDDHKFTSSYYSVKRFLRRLGESAPLPFRRMECAPGEQAQIDFGRGAPIVDGGGVRRLTHAFRIVLGHSRKGYSEAVFRQTTDSLLLCLENAFWAWGGVPRTLVPDNLRAAVIKADWYDPELNPRVLAFCEHYGTVILPTRPYTPRHKGKVERGIAYVQDNGLKGRQFASLADENRHLAEWEATVADTRIHGTTRKQVGKVFADVERPALLGLPAGRFPFFREAQRKVHRDGHVEVEKAYYSVPPEYVGHEVWVRWDGRMVRVFTRRMEQIALHAQQEAGRFSTRSEDIHSRKVSSVERGAEYLLEKAGRIGLSAERWARAMLQARGIEGIRVLQGLVSLCGQHESKEIDAACAIALTHEAFRLRAIRELIKRGSGGKQESFEYLAEHEIIRDMADYGSIVAASLRGQSVEAMALAKE
jgi:transposase